MKDNFIEIYDNALSNDSCKYIINCFKEFENYTHVGTQGNGTVNTSRKDSLDLNLITIRHLLSEFIFDEFRSSLKKNIDKYTDKYKMITDDQRFWDHHIIFDQAILAKKYKKNKGGYHAWHQDWSSDRRELALRQLVCMYYLNTVEEGGETEFWNQKFKTKPKKGSLVIFPAGFTHLHKGNIPVSNDKYILNFWIIRSQPVFTKGFSMNKDNEKREHEYI